jgi:hypothetical protein
LILQSFDRAIDVVERGVEAHDTRGSLDYVVHLMSLPALLGLTLADLPLAQGYLKPAECDRVVWRERLLVARHLKVGIVWAGRPSHVDDRKRSLPLHRLAPLFDIEGIAWYSLRLGKAREQLAAAGGSVIDLASELRDFADTAAAVAELDLVIAVDTAVAHLAAAMGRPVWLLVPAAADWRWLVEGDESPWYPTLRLFRQKRAGDWKSVVDTVCQSLETMTAGARRHADA